MYALAHINLGPLLLCGILEFSYDELIGNRKFHTRITRDKHKDCKVRQELYLTHQIRKSPTGCRAFLLSECSRKISIMLILEKLNVLSYATLLLLTNTLIPTNMVKTDCKKLAINNPTKNFNKIDKLIASVLAKPSIDRKPAKDR